jgi:hypothetical protein
MMRIKAKNISLLCRVPQDPSRIILDSVSTYATMQEERAMSPLPYSTPCGIGVSFRFLCESAALAVQEVLPNETGAQLPFLKDDILVEVRENTHAHVVMRFV